MIDLNEYLASFLGDTLDDKIGVTELNEIILNIMPNRRYKQAYVQGFDCEYISFKKDVHIFERTEIDEYIYKGVVEPSYKKIPRQIPTLLVLAGIREDNPPHLRLTTVQVRVLASAENDM